MIYELSTGIYNPDRQKNPASDKIASSIVRRDGRVVECAGLEIRYTARPYRGYKSLSLRHYLHQANNNINIFSVFLLICPEL